MVIYMKVRGVLIFFLLFLLSACSNENKEDLLESGVNTLRSGNIRGAIVYLRNALEIDPSFLEARYHLGDAYLKTKQYLQAQHEFEKIYHQDPGYADLPLKLAETYRFTDQYDKAIDILKIYHKNNSPDSESLDLLGIVLSLNHDYENAEYNFRRAAELDSQNPLPIFHLAQSLLAHEETEAAVTILSDLKKEFPEFIPAHELLAELYLSQGRIDLASDIYADIYSVDVTNIHALYMQGLLYLIQGQQDSARQIVNEFSSQFPGDFRYHQLRGIVEYKANNNRDAVVSLRQSLKNKPDVLTYYYLGLCHYRQNELELAVNQFQRVLDENPRSSQARMMLAVTLLKQNRLDDSEQQLRYALKEDKQKGLAYNILGSIYLQQKRYDKALETFSKAVEVEPTLVDVHLKKSRTHLLLGEAEMAEDELISALEKSPHILNTRIILASYYISRKDYEKARDTLKLGLAGDSSDAVLYQLLADISLHLENFDQARIYLNNAKNSYPDYLAPYFNLAFLHSVQGNYSKANKEYQALLSKAPGNTKALIERGLIFELIGNPELAAQSFEQLKNTDSPKSWLEYARYQSRNGDVEKALLSIEKGLIQHSGNIQLLKEKIELLVHQRRFDEAEKFIEELGKTSSLAYDKIKIDLLLAANNTNEAYAHASSLLNTGAKTPEASLLVAKAFEAAGNLEKAQEIIKAALTAHPGQPDLLLVSGLLYEKMMNGNKAVSYYKEIIQENPDFYQAYFALGSFHNRQGNDDLARQFYEKTLSIEKKFVPAMNNLALLDIEDQRIQNALILALRAYLLAPGEPAVLDTFGLSLRNSGQTEYAVRVLKQARDLSKGNPTIRYHLALSYIDGGKFDLAADELKQALEAGEFAEAEKCRELLDRING